MTTCILRYHLLLDVRLYVYILSLLIFILQKISGIRVPLTIKITSPRGGRSKVIKRDYFQQDHPLPCAVTKQVIKKFHYLICHNLFLNLTTNFVPVPDAVLDHRVPITTLNDCEMTLNIEGLWCRKSCITVFLNCVWPGDFIIVCYFIQQYTLWYKVMQNYLLLIKSWYTAKDNTHCSILIVTVYNDLFGCSSCLYSEKTKS